MSRYHPEPVPEVRDNPDELRRYIDQELNRIAEVVNVKVDRSFGGLFQTTEFTFSPLTPTPELFDAFDEVIPAVPDGVAGVAQLGTLVVLTGGTYLISFTTTVINILPNAEYGFLLALNGASTGLGGTIEPSNQTEIVTIGFNILFTADKGDVFTMLINSPTSDDATVVNSEFIASRVSETTD